MVVGIFEADGGIYETEIWCDSRVLQGAYRRGNTLSNGAGAPRLGRELQHVPRLAASNPQVNVQVRRETEYYAAQSRALTRSSRAWALASRP